MTYDELEPSADYLAMLLDGEPFTGVAYETDSRGSVLSEESFVNGMKEGFVREWDASGQLRKEAQRHLGVVHGTLRRWHENGRLAVEGEFEYGIAIHERRWDAEGVLEDEHHLDPSDPQYEILVLARKRYGPEATEEHPDPEKAFRTGQMTPIDVEAAERHWNAPAIKAAGLVQRIRDRLTSR